MNKRNNKTVSRVLQADVECSGADACSAGAGGACGAVVAVGAGAGGVREGRGVLAAGAGAGTGRGEGGSSAPYSAALSPYSPAFKPGREVRDGAAYGCVCIIFTRQSHTRIEYKI